MPSVGPFPMFFHHKQTRTPPWSVFGSLLVHGGLLALIVLVASPQVLHPPAARAIAVDMVTEAQFHAMTRPAAASPSPEPLASQPVPLAAPASPPATPKAAADGMVHASQFYASDILSDPANAEVRKTFPLLASDEQIVQLCNMEALEQLHQWKADLNPDALVGYAFADPVIANGVLDAQGGAFRSAAHWYRIRYHCAVGADVKSVSAFEFAVGALVPEAEWESHNLNRDDDWLD